MSLPIKSQDVWKPATDGDKLKAMSMLGPLPARKALSEKIEDETYNIAMDGMTAYGLEQAVKAALRGEHGSTFFPSPPELRGLHDAAMRQHREARAHASRQERIERERIPPRVEPTPEQKARVAKLMADFRASHEAAKQEDIEAERAEIRQRNGMTPEALASIPDAPIGSWEKPQLKKPAE